MAAPKLPAFLSSLGKKAGAALSGLRHKLPGAAKEESDDFYEDDASSEEEAEPKDVSGKEKGLKKASVDKAKANVDRREAFKGFIGAVLHSRLAVILIVSCLALVLALAIVSVIVNLAPPSTTRSSVNSSGAALLGRFLLPHVPSIEPRVELERERGRMYTDEDFVEFGTKPSSVELKELHDRNQAEIEALYETLP